MVVIKGSYDNRVHFEEISGLVTVHCALQILKATFSIIRSILILKDLQKSFKICFRETMSNSDFVVKLDLINPLV